MTAPSRVDTYWLAKGLLLMVAFAASCALTLAQGQKQKRVEPEQEANLTVRAGDVLLCPAAHPELDYPPAIGPDTVLAVDGSGNVYFSAGTIAAGCVYRLDGWGKVTRVAGGGSENVDGATPASRASLPYAYGLALDDTGNLFIVAGISILKVSPDGRISTVFRNCDGEAPCPRPGTALNDPRGLALDSSGNLYVANYSSNRVVEIHTDGTFEVIAGTGESGFSGDGGPATEATLNGPYDVAIDSAGNVYVADMGNDRIRRVGTDGIIVTVAGNGESGYSGDGGRAAWTKLYGPTGIAVDASGNLYIADSGNNRVRKVTRGGIISTLATPDGIGSFGAHPKGPAVEKVAVDANGNVYVYDARNEEIKKVSSLGIVTTLVRTVAKYK